MLVALKEAHPAVGKGIGAVLFELSLPAAIARIVTYDRHDPGTSIHATLFPCTFAPVRGSNLGSLGPYTKNGSSKSTTWMMSSLARSVYARTLPVLPVWSSPLPA